MSTTLTVVCPNCDVPNRVPETRLVDGRSAVCGKCKAKLFPGHPIVLDDAIRFQKHIADTDLPVLVDFWAPWCGPCLMMASEFETAAARLEPRVRLAKVNTEFVDEVGARYGIRAIPTMILFDRGREVARQSGAMQAAGIVRFAESALGRKVA
jgi:thioredoxin 2